MDLESTISKLNSSLSEARNERMQMIEAHQNRIRHLQEKFLKELDLATAQKIEQQKELMNNEADKKVEAAVKEMELRLEEKHQQETLILNRELEDLKRNYRISQSKLENEAKKETKLLEIQFQEELRAQKVFDS
jgi:hypothetical protein